MVDLERLRKLMTSGASLRDAGEEDSKPKRDPRPGKPRERLRRKEPEIFVAVADRENYFVCKERRIYAVKREAQLQRIQADDLIVFYVTKTSQFPGIYKVTREVYSAGKSPFRSPFYRFHIDLKPVAELPEEKWLNVVDLKNKLHAIKDKNVAPGKFFQTILRTLDKKDYQVIFSAMSRLGKKK